MSLPIAPENTAKHWVKRGAALFSETIKSSTYHDMLEDRRESAYLVMDTIGHQAGIDRVRFFYAPLLLGGERALSAVGGHGFDAPAVAARLSDLSYEQVGPDLLVTGSIAPR
jgi:hypothetical protein